MFFEALIGFTWTYLRCILKNRYLFIGYLFFLEGVLLAFLDYHTHTHWGWFVLDGVIALAGLIVLLLTRFGAASMMGYALTIRHFRQNERVDTRYVALLGTTYCARVGVLIALSDIRHFLSKGAPA